MLSISPYKHLAENGESQSANCFWFHWASLSWPTSASWWCCWLYDRCIGVFRVKRKSPDRQCWFEEWDCWSKDFAIPHNLHHCNLNCQSPSDNRCYPLPQFHHLLASVVVTIVTFFVLRHFQSLPSKSVTIIKSSWWPPWMIGRTLKCWKISSAVSLKVSQSFSFNRDNNFNAVFLVGIFFA